MSQNHRPNGHKHTHQHRQSSHTHQSHHHEHDADVQEAAARRVSKGKNKAMDIPNTNPQNNQSHLRQVETGAGTGTPDESLHAMLDEAIHTSLSPPSSSSLNRQYDRNTPITQLPEAHRAPLNQPGHPHLLTQLTRATLPISTLNYESPQISRRDRTVSQTHSGFIPQFGESSTAWQRAYPTTALSDEPFPDLDPTTGLPLDFRSPRRDSSSSSAPSLHLQRTITGLLQASPSKPKTSSSILPSVPSMPSLPSVQMPNINFSIPRVSLPSKPSFDFSTSKRPLSSSSPTEDWTSWATSWWSGNKGRVDEMMSEDDQADTVEEEKEKLRRKYRSPQNPVIFCHGLLGFDYIGPSSLPPLQISHWRGIREVLESNGVEVMIARVPATSSIKDRAKTLEELISSKFPGREVNLVGHSMGGLDCRYLISELRPKAFHPISLTTISTPHRGSPFADYVIDNVIGRERLPSLLSLIEALHLPQSGGDGTAFSALGTHSMKEFNAQILDREDVKYYSWGASFEPGLLDTFRWPHSVILAKEGPNDGLVSVNSARWGEYRGTLLGVNHLDLVGWVNHVRYVLSNLTGNPIAFKPATFYLEVADYLAEQGF